MIEDIHEPGLTPEHPYGDTIQLFMFILFFLIWGLDSFVYDIFGLNTLLSLPYRVALSVPFFASSLYLALKSLFVIFRGRGNEELVMTGVYSLVRHPMYLGGLLFYLGFVALALSVPAFAFWGVMFVVYDRLAEYEEEKLASLLGEEYEEYREEVPKWNPSRVKLIQSRD